MVTTLVLATNRIRSRLSWVFAGLTFRTEGGSCGESQNGSQKEPLSARLPQSAEVREAQEQSGGSEAPASERGKGACHERIYPWNVVSCALVLWETELAQPLLRSVLRTGASRTSFVMGGIKVICRGGKDRKPLDRDSTPRLSLLGYICP